MLALKPDLVIAWKSGNQSEDLAQIERLGIKVYLSNPTTIAGVAHELLTFGEFTGNIEQSQQAANAFTQKLNAIVKSQQDKKDITGFYQLWAEPMMTVGKNTWINQLIETCHEVMYLPIALQIIRKLVSKMLLLLSRKLLLSLMKNQKHHSRLLIGKSGQKYQQLKMINLLA
ncbi:helical backbone metal receptor [Pseudoalteromonas sp. B193]